MLLENIYCFLSSDFTVIAGVITDFFERLGRDCFKEPEESGGGAPNKQITHTHTQTEREREREREGGRGRERTNICLLGRCGILRLLWTSSSLNTSSITAAHSYIIVAFFSPPGSL